jgi:hypothetical protein
MGGADGHQDRPGHQLAVLPRLAVGRDAPDDEIQNEDSAQAQ